MRTGMMSYKGYRAAISYDEEDHVFVGRVFGIKDVLGFHGKSIDELENSFHDCIDEYLELCKENGKEPEKEYSGVFNVRVSPSIHLKAAEYAFANGYTLNKVVAMAMEAFLN